MITITFRRQAFCYFHKQQACDERKMQNRSMEPEFEWGLVQMKKNTGALNTNEKKQNHKQWRLVQVEIVNNVGNSGTTTTNIILVDAQWCLLSCGTKISKSKKMALTTNEKK
jgi:hypothetical protein